MADELASVPDVLAAGLRCVFCGINPGYRSAAAHAHFANPRNDFWRLLHDAGFTPRLYDPSDQRSLLELGYGLTNAASRTTAGSGGLRRGDFERARIEELAASLRPRAIAFVGKAAYHGLFGERPQLGPQLRSLGSSGLYVLPSTSPANAAVPYRERLRWFSDLARWLEPSPRRAVRALLVDEHERVLLARFDNRGSGESWWATPGGGVEEGEGELESLRRELLEECGLEAEPRGEPVWLRDHVYPWEGRLLRQQERIWLLRVPPFEPRPRVELRGEGIGALRWWTLAELATTRERLAPAALAEGVALLLRSPPPGGPIDVSERH